MDRSCDKCKHSSKNNGTGELCSGLRCGADYYLFEPIRKEKPMEKKYRVLNSFYRFVDGTKYSTNSIVSAKDLEYIDINLLISKGYIEEVKEDTLDDLFDEYFVSNGYKVEAKKLITDWHIRQEIELLEEILEPINSSNFSRIIKFKISELENKLKEIK